MFKIECKFRQGRLLVKTDNFIIWSDEPLGKQPLHALSPPTLLKL